MSSKTDETKLERIGVEVFRREVLGEVADFRPDGSV
jgi:hypothetical protein